MCLLRFSGVKGKEERLIYISGIKLLEEGRKETRARDSRGKELYPLFAGVDQVS